MGGIIPPATMGPHSGGRRTGRWRLSAMAGMWCASAVASSAAPPAPVVQVGLEVLEADQASALRGKSVGLVVTPGSVTADGRHSIDVLRKAGVNVVRLLAHERALRTRSAAWDKVPQNLDGTPFVGRPQVASGGRVDAETRLPIFDLGGEKLDPASVRGLGALVFDLQDPGVRFFTVMGRLQQCMEAAAEAGIEFVVPVFVWAGPTALDDLVGTSRLRQLLDAEESVGQILAADVAAIERFRKDRARFLLY